jgi:hypothetical protein
MRIISNAFSLFIIIAIVVMALYGKPKQHASMDLSEDDLFCMVQNLYFEAGNQGGLLLDSRVVACEDDVY